MSADDATNVETASEGGNQTATKATTQATTRPAGTTAPAGSSATRVRTRKATGVLPDQVIADPRAEAAFVFVTLDPALDRNALQEWLTQAGHLQATLNAATAPSPGRGRRQSRVATAALGLGSRFLARFNDPSRMPVGLRTENVPRLPANTELLDVDGVFYIMTTSEAALAEFFTGLSRARPAVTAVAVERGFQRRDHREVFGHLDGERNMRRADRPRGAFTLVDDHPDEPGWVDGGAYFAYLKISQDLAAWEALDPTAREQVVGRRLADGSRLDLPAGSDPHGEGPFADAGIPAPNSHVRKAGPRGAGHDAVSMLRRGVPYLTLAADGSIEAGLHFASFQGDLEVVDVVLNDWMLNPDFPTPGAQVDGLLASNLTSFRRAGFFFVPPTDPRFPGAALFEPARAPGRPRLKTGQVHVRKRFVDGAGQRVPRDRAGVGFALFDRATGAQVGESFSTDGAGRAVSPGVPLHATYLLREVTPPPSVTPPGDVVVELSRRHQPVTVTNTVTGPGYA